MKAKSGKQAMADLESALHEVREQTGKALQLASSGASTEDQRKVFERANDAILKANGARLHTYHASTGTNPDLGTPLEKAALAAAAERAREELNAAKRKLFGNPGL